MTRSLSFMKYLFPLIMTLMLIPSGHAFSLYLGTRVGFDVGYNHGDIRFTLPAQNNQTFHMGMYRMHSSFGGGLFMDVDLLPFLALTPQFHFQIYRHAQAIDPTQEQIIATWHELTLETLLKFKFSWWYLGGGIGVVFNTTPQFSNNNHMHNITAKGSHNIVVVTEGGLQIPFSLIFFQVALRSSINPKAIQQISHNSPYGYMRNAFNIGLFFGLGVRLVG
ncbi:hypothetical protein PVA45_08160 (plasmid) [Entomospira entomophila]|uniref:Outer membrane protein beta-barrel domain-containing protein n=1 Tax=Entomospira entomophila TaxID=2719988 RepID=A0A968GFG9_9SPIO|nr:hypothetical protein [Entomospira entomophilus]NIZ41479.1 hypothetical protein [Entomospira entomophilus]WDI36313.1 hypothetical protein PVA45_08160 [Entomospira entomophilus]